jgi:hypothetical protein
MTSIKLIVFCAILPFAAYVLFVFYHLAVDVLQAILALPRRKRDETG